FIGKMIRRGTWGLSALAMSVLAWYSFADPYYHAMSFRQWVVVVVVIIYASKLFSIVFILIDDIQIYTRRLIRYIRQRTSREKLPGKPITRGQFLDKAAIFAGSIPFASMIGGIITGATDYRV